MGQIPNKTYKAPDGSVYRVEDDGSVTKINDGHVKSTELPSKYNITPEGKIYRVEDDGSVTYLGHAEERQTPPDLPPTRGPKNPNLKFGWIILIVLLIVAASIGGYYAYVAIFKGVRSPQYIEYTDTLATEQEVTEVVEEYNEPEPSASAEKEDITQFYPGGVEGNFSGVIEGLGYISGIWTCGSQMGGGWYCFDDQNELSGRDLDFNIENPLVWREGINEGRYHETTGTWYFNYFNGTQDTIATGTYVRSADDRSFRFTLYKD